jgi:hypothetical protein
MSFGLQLFNQAGTLVLNISSRVLRFVTFGTTGTVSPGSSVTITIPGMENNDSWNVQYTNYLQGSTMTINSGSFTLFNNDPFTSAQFEYWVFRS